MAMTRKEYTFFCPVCEQPGGTIIRASQEELRTAAADHIRLHEERAAQIAEARVRAEQKTTIHSGAETREPDYSQLVLTTADRNLLAGMKISTN